MPMEDGMREVFAGPLEALRDAGRGVEVIGDALVDEKGLEHGVQDRRCRHLVDRDPDDILAHVP